MTCSCSASPSAHRQFALPHRRRCVMTVPRTIFGTFALAFFATAHSVPPPLCPLLTGRFSAAGIEGGWIRRPVRRRRARAQLREQDERPQQRSLWGSRTLLSLARGPGGPPIVATCTNPRFRFASVPPWQPPKPQGGAVKRIRDKVAGLDVHRDTVVACARIVEPDRVEDHVAM